MNIQKNKLIATTINEHVDNKWNIIYDLLIEEQDTNGDEISSEWESFNTIKNAENRRDDINNNNYNWKNLPIK